MSLFVNKANRCSDDLAPASDPKSRSERWGETIKKIDDSFAKSLQKDANQMSLVQLRRPRDAAPAAPSDDYSSVLTAPGVLPRDTSVAVRPQHYISRRSLREWIQLQKTLHAGDVAKTKRYFERCVGILHSLVLKMIVTVMINGKAGLEVTTDPKLISVDNLVVTQSLEEGESLHFVIDSDMVGLPANDVDMKYKYGAMKALGTVAYELMMRGSGPPIMAFLPSTITNSDGTSELLLSLNETSTRGNEGKTKRQRPAGRMQGMLPSAMIDAEVPYPLCRFVVDLLGGECSDGSLFRSDNSFDSFSDVLGDLEQMMKNPEAFIHLGVRDQWKLAFGEKMHGREAEKGKLLEVASRITGVTSNDALLEALVLVHSDDKQQIVLFDRIVHSEPLSVMAGAFDEFLFHCVGNSRQFRIKTNLKKLMEPEDIAILAKHVPCLVNYVDSPLQHIHEFQVNKEQIHQLFGKLIKVLSAAGPVVLFADDLQWADATSIDLFLALSKASEPNLSSDGCAERQPKTLLIGSYRDNEVQDNKQLQEMLDQLKTTKSVQVTEIPVGGFDGGTLNAIVSESLCLPLRRTKPLTEIILQKTDGIIIHIIEFIGRLTMERILCHSFVKGWEWDSEVIESCPISESVAELFTFKLRTLSDKALMGLQICSVFGIYVDQRIINFIQGYDGERSANISVGLHAATELGLIEAAGSPNDFRFAHDLILQPLAPLDVYLSNEDLLLKKDELDPISYESIILLELTKWFVMRHMEKANEMADLGKESFKMKRMALFYVNFDLYAGMIACYFARQTGDSSQLEEVQKICNQLDHLRNYSKWNMEHKYHLLKAEYHYSNGENGKAIESYQKAINAAKEHKFVHEMAIGCELAGYFYKEQGDEVKAGEMFNQAREAYIEWGAIEKGKMLT
ncbi:hypothetical protein ACHAWO_004443 [Cyclotella atomus]|uniref:Orc1-like AAA ATPase domain-containing protein n=1 Tax=Cyclotella atomus TaxID=382360 RepID=A0ABD3PEP2_9STRA